MVVQSNLSFAVNFRVVFNQIGQCTENDNKTITKNLFQLQSWSGCSRAPKSYGFRDFQLDNRLFKVNFFFTGQFTPPQIDLKRLIQKMGRLEINHDGKTN